MGASTEVAEMLLDLQNLVHNICQLEMEIIRCRILGAILRCRRLWMQAFDIPLLTFYMHIHTSCDSRWYQ